MHTKLTYTNRTDRGDMEYGFILLLPDYVIIIMVISGISITPGRGA